MKTTPLVKPIYIDPDTNRAVTTHSMIKTMRRCPRQFWYKYILRLKRRVESKPLERGKWMHFLLEARYAALMWDQAKAAGLHDEDEDQRPNWRTVHEQLCTRYYKLFDEEQEKLGDLPTECKNLMISYEWYYGPTEDDWVILAVEQELEVIMPDGAIYRAKVDLIIRNALGTWIVDHKFKKGGEDSFLERLLDSQSGLYVWAGEELEIEDLQGFIWNYVTTEAIKPPVVLKNGSRLSKNSPSTDYPHIVRYLKQHPEHKALLLPLARQLKTQRYEPNATQNSPFFRRTIMERNDEMLDQVVKSAYRTHRRMHTYPWDDVDSIERVPDRSCGWMCSYSRLCSTELFGGNRDNVIRSEFKVADPLDYYHDRPDGERD